MPWRQWVLSFEGPMAVRLGYDRELLARVCQRFAKRVMQALRGEAHPREPMGGDIQQLFVAGGPGVGRQLELGLQDKQG